MLRAHNGGLLREVRRLRLQYQGALRPLRRLSAYRNDQLRPVFTTTAPLTVEASGSPTSGSAFGNGNTAQTDPVQAIVSGGTGPYTYAWTVASHDSGLTPTATSPTFANTSFRQSGLSPGEVYFATFRCLVTDATGATGMCTASATFYGPSFGGGGGLQP